MNDECEHCGEEIARLRGHIRNMEAHLPKEVRRSAYANARAETLAEVREYITDNMFVDGWGVYAVYVEDLIAVLDRLSEGGEG